MNISKSGLWLGPLFLMVRMIIPRTIGSADTKKSRVMRQENISPWLHQKMNELLVVHAHRPIHHQRVPDISSYMQSAAQHDNPAIV